MDDAGRKANLYACIGPRDRGGPGSIDQAHKPDEFITVDQVERCDAMLDALLLRLA